MVVDLSSPVARQRVDWNKKTINEKVAPVQSCDNQAHDKTSDVSSMSAETLSTRSCKESVVLTFCLKGQRTPSTTNQSHVWIRTSAGRALPLKGNLEYCNETTKSQTIQINTFDASSEASAMRTVLENFVEFHEPSQMSKNEFRSTHGSAGIVWLGPCALGREAADLARAESRWTHVSIDCYLTSTTPSFGSCRGVDISIGNTCLESLI